LTLLDRAVILIAYEYKYFYTKFGPHQARRGKQNLGNRTIIPVALGLSWTVFLVILFVSDLRNERRQMLQVAVQQARAFFQQIVTTREWNADHGGIYVPVTEETKPNPYLEGTDRILVTTEGLTLAKINPAYMTRQIADIASTKNYVKFRVTSLKPVRPANAPDAWEAAALVSFEEGIGETYEFTGTNDDGGVFRYMAPLRVTGPCLKCHAKQGYQEGDPRGGISVSIPAAALLASHKSEIMWLGITYTFLWLVGLGAIPLTIYALTQRREAERRALFSSVLMMGQEKERKRIGQELHDGIAQYLSAIKLRMEDILKQAGEGRAEEAIKSLEPLVPATQKAAEDLRRVVMGLWPSTLDALGILATISWVCREFEKGCSGVCIETDVTVEEHEVPDSLKIVICRVLQEALANVGKHSKAELVYVCLRKTANAIELTVEDNGIGLGEKSSNTGFGLASMRSRTELGGGSFSVESGRGMGTTVRASWPCKTG
jgi:signal transduction histidine kinase